MNAAILHQSDVPLPMASAWKRMMVASGRMASVQQVYRDYNHRGIAIPDTWGDFANVWAEYQAANEEEVNATDAYRRECRKAGYTGNRFPHLR